MRIFIRNETEGIPHSRSWARNLTLEFLVHYMQGHHNSAVWQASIPQNRTSSPRPKHV